MNKISSRTYLAVVFNRHEKCVEQNSCKYQILTNWTFDYRFKTFPSLEQRDETTCVGDSIKAAAAKYLKTGDMFRLCLFSSI